MEKRNTMKAARNEAKGMKDEGDNFFQTLKKRKVFKRAERIKAKKTMTTDRASQIEEVNSQRKKQNEQGVNHRLGKKNRVVTQEGVKGSPFTSAKPGAANLKTLIKKWL